ncbi:MAG TPA: hypothetical protein PK867_19165 [Pirellulales bacterium]|nr:hypothetical protein [Pirellulales bacterium]
MDGPLTFRLMFDFDLRLLRCEREQPISVTSPLRADNPANSAPPGAPVFDGQVLGAPHLITVKQTYFRKPGEAVIYQKGETYVMIYGEETKPPDSMLAFDILATGLLFRQTYCEQTSFAEVYDALARFDADDVADEGNGVERIRWTIGDDHRRFLWIDKHRGFSPTRFEARDRRMSRRTRDGSWPEPYLINTASWKAVNDVWVPASWEIQERREEEAIWKYEHEFEWRSVNEPLPEDLFTVDGLGCPAGTRVTNVKGQAAVIERVIGEPDSPKKGKVFVIQHATKQQPAAPGWGQKWFFWGNAIVIGILILVQAFRHVHRRLRLRKPGA